MMKQVCAECGKKFNVSEMKEVDGELYCQDCYDFEFVKCCVCGEDVKKDDGYRVNDKWYCDDCYDENIADCANCGMTCEKDEMEDTVDGLVCQDCRENRYVECDSCGDVVRANCVTEVESGDVVCVDCLNENYTRCSVCGDWVCNDNARSDSWDYYCSSCWDDKRHNTINDHDYKPEPHFYPVPGKPCYFGVELEVDDTNDNDLERDETAEKVIEKGDGKLYCKYDGSLSAGFEIVTHPCTVDYHMNSFPWKDITNICYEAGYRSHDAGTCGLHVHISRNIFGVPGDEQDYNICKLLLLFEHNWNNLVKFSRRKDSELNQWASRYGNNVFEKDEDLLRRAKGSGRYFAVNLENHSTVEIRIFKGTLNAETIIGSIQLVDTLTKMAIDLDIEQIRKVNFLSIYKKAKTLKYNQLMRVIENRVILKGTKLLAPDLKIGQKVKVENKEVNGYVFGITKDYVYLLSEDKTEIFSAYRKYIKPIQGNIALTDFAEKKQVSFEDTYSGHYGVGQILKVGNDDSLLIHFDTFKNKKHNSINEDCNLWVELTENQIVKFINKGDVVACA